MCPDPRATRGGRIWPYTDTLFDHCGPRQPPEHQKEFIYNKQAQQTTQSISHLIWNTGKVADIPTWRFLKGQDRTWYTVFLLFIPFPGSRVQRLLSGPWKCKGYRPEPQFPRPERSDVLLWEAQWPKPPPATARQLGTTGRHQSVSPYWDEMWERPSETTLFSHWGCVLV